jgi:hypothetical protein
MSDSDAAFFFFLVLLELNGKRKKERKIFFFLIFCRNYMRPAKESRKRKENQLYLY